MPNQPGRRHRTFTPEEKAAALARILTGVTITQVAEEMGTNRITIRSWRDQAGLSKHEMPEAKKEELGELVTEYLREALRTLRTQAGAFANREWLEGQNAHDVGILHGILADKTTRILAAIRDE